MEYMLSLDTKSVVPLKLLAALKRIRDERLYAADTMIGPENYMVKRLVGTEFHAMAVR